MKSIAAWGAVVAATGLLAVTARAMDDDLSVVKKAVQAKPATAPAPRVSAGQPRWFKVRVVEKGSGKTRVTVNLPLTLVRAVGEGWPEIKWRCPGENTTGALCAVKLVQVLDSLEAGQSLVEVDDEKEQVKVWIE